MGPLCTPPPIHTNRSAKQEICFLDNSQHADNIISFISNVYFSRFSSNWITTDYESTVLHNILELIRFYIDNHVMLACLLFPGCKIIVWIRLSTIHFCQLSMVHNNVNWFSSHHMILTHNQLECIWLKVDLVITTNREKEINIQERYECLFLDVTRLWIFRFKHPNQVPQWSFSFLPGKRLNFCNQKKKL